MKKTLGFISIALCSLSITGYAAPTQTTTVQPAATTAQTIAAQPSTTTPTTSNSSGLNLGFVVTGSSAQLKSLTGKSGYYTVTLSDVSPYITYFSERPNRKEGVATMQNFISAWSVGSNSFKDNPPNGILTGAMINQNTNQNDTYQILILESPQYNAQASTLTFTARPLGTNALPYSALQYTSAILYIN
jgi:hypothetical protein